MVKSAGAWSTLLIVGLLNFIIPTGLLVWPREGQVWTNEHLPVQMLMAGMHLAASALFLGIAACQPSAVWKWTVTGVFSLVGILLWTLYLYVRLNPQGMAAVVFFWGPILEMAIAGLLMAIGVGIAYLNRNPQRDIR